MTEKRFKADKYNFEIWDNDDFLLSFDQTVDLLNQLNEENEQLKTYKKKVAKAFKVAINETTLTKQTENSLRTISKILEVDLE